MDEHELIDEACRRFMARKGWNLMKSENTEPMSLAAVLVLIGVQLPEDHSVVDKIGALLARKVGKKLGVTLSFDEERDRMIVLAWHTPLVVATFKGKTRIDTVDITSEWLTKRGYRMA